MSEERTTRSEKRKRKGSGLPPILWVLIFVIFFAVILLEAFFSDTGILNVWHMEEEYKAYEAENETLKQIVKEREEEVRQLKENPILLEEVAREKLNMARPQEDVYLFDKEPEIQEN